jgi:hypothetical protein
LIDHVTIVVNSEPLDKRCHTVSVVAGGVERDLLTWKALPPRTSEEDANNPRPGSNGTENRVKHCRLSALVWVLSNKLLDIMNYLCNHKQE